MNAAEIIEEIKTLPRGEKAKVLEFVEELPEENELSPKELTNIVRKIAVTEDAEEERELREQFMQGFYETVEKP